MPSGLFRHEIVHDDPRIPTIITTCSYSLAGLFLGMFLTLSGLMLTTFANEHRMETPTNEQKSFMGNYTAAYIFSLSLLITGCVLILFSIIAFLVASIMYTSRPNPVEFVSDNVNN
ncbi:hypothetical protein RDWZM_000576 [Blomia tropicalis]|uniref:Uncharacterized protein n=1 Tax=Blomia tropicalis TaxID=40697 RepID=A0A9Q0MA11_BLOTA|nr:hypothetical protein BLOT_012250 [Blomia tropicalis]KAJ6222031.1 hypothetical protein RDWZM_000576 [Blomia tropicalis]